MRGGTDGSTRAERSWLAFTDEQTEGEFWQYWEDMSRPLAALLSLLMALAYPVGLYNMVGNCRWSRGPCVLAGAIQAACAVEHAAIYSVLVWRGRAWRLPERTKAWVLLGDMLACMLLMMLVRDMDEVPGVTHSAAYMVHGWQIFFIQPSVTTGVHLHLLNFLAYAMVEAHLAVNLGAPHFLRGGLRRLIRLLVFFAVLPFTAGIACELWLRHSFLQKRRPAARAALSRARSD
ncbi:g5205 [Coccomyxa elongata]